MGGGAGAFGRVPNVLLRGLCNLAGGVPSRLLSPVRSVLAEQPPGARRLLGQNALWWLAVTLAGTFVHAFLYRSTRDARVSAVFSLYAFLTFTVAAPTVGWLLKRVDRASMWRLGTLAHAAVYLAFLLLGETAGRHPGLMGVLMGLGIVLFWPANGLLAFHVTEPRTRASFHALGGIVLTGSGIVVPPVAGSLVEAVGAAWGYPLLFGGALLLFAVAIAVSFGHAPGASRAEPFRLAEATRRCLSLPLWRRLLAVHLLLGVREGILLFLPGLLVFIATGSESALGTYTLFVNLLSAIAFYAAGRAYQGRIRTLPLALGAAGLAASPLLLLVGHPMTALLLFGTVTALATPFLAVAWMTVTFNLTDADPTARRHLQEYQTLRDVLFNFGRCVAIAAFVFWVPRPESVREVMLILLVTSAAVVPGAAVLASLGSPSPGVALTSGASIAPAPRTERSAAPR